MTKFAPVTDAQIRTLRTEAFAAGDASTGYVCHLALLDEHSVDELADAAWLNDNTVLNRGEILELESINQADARRICERVIGTAAAQR